MLLLYFYLLEGGEGVHGADGVALLVAEVVVGRYNYLNNAAIVVVRQLR